MSEFLGLEGKVAVVTGGASGLGQAVARGLVREGARVVLGDVDMAGLASTAAAVRWMRTDVITGTTILVDGEFVRSVL